MEEKRNVTICFNSDEMYIVKYFQDKGKLSTEMKRVLKDYVDSNGSNSDLEEILDTRLAKILSVVVGNGMTSIGTNSFSPEMFSQLNNFQNSTANSVNPPDNELVEEEEDEEVEADSFSLPPASMLESFPFFNVSDEDEDEDE